MASLIENILSIENQANDMVAKAQAEAKAMEKTGQADIERLRQDIQAQVDLRIEAFRKEASEKNQATLAQEKEQAKRQSAALDKADAAKAQKLAALVVAKFRER